MPRQPPIQAGQAANPVASSRASAAARSGGDRGYSDVVAGRSAAA
jgi:hypothetical protein